MQFKIDENLPTEIAELLTAAGYDAKTVNDQKLQGEHPAIQKNIYWKYSVK